jgi:hypothetical protein
MKKILATVVILALCAPAMAAVTVVIADNPADDTGTITVSSDAGNIVGLGLDIEVTGGNITDVSIEPSTFEIYPDTAQELGESYGYGDYGDNGPIAEQLEAGSKALPASSFAISVGMLNGEEIAGAAGAASVVITVTVDANVNVCVSENALRGGIVLTTGAGDDITGDEVCDDITTGALPYCGTGTETQDFKDQWDWVTSLMGAEPTIWCTPRQCFGDANNQLEGKQNFYALSGDLTVLLDAWNKTADDPAMIADPSLIGADFDRLPEGKQNFRVLSGDLTILLANWNISNDTTPPPVCAYDTGRQENPNENL